jgi:hypothetical protein
MSLKLVCTCGCFLNHQGCHCFAVDCSALCITDWSAALPDTSLITILLACCMIPQTLEASAKPRVTCI